MASIKQKTMLTAGERAPEFELEDMSGNRHSLSDIAAEKPVVLAFFKVSCPVCQFAFPFLERMKNQQIPIYAISQDGPESTRSFHSEYGITLATLLDKEEQGYPASNAYGLAHVPSIFLVEPDGRISQAMMGFEKKGLEQLGQRLGKEPFKPTDYVPEFKAG
jgi:peroxiredoxin